MDQTDAVQDTRPTQWVVTMRQSHFATRTAPYQFARALQQFVDRYPAT